MFLRTIYFGMTDRRIALLQQLLNEILKPSPNLNVSGKYDSDTRDALRRFERGIETINGNKVNVYGRASIFPIDGKIDEAAWVAIGTALKQSAPERFRVLVTGDQELSDLFGLVPGTLEINEFPAFKPDDLKDVLAGLNLAKKKVNESIKKDNVLQAKYGIPSVLALLEGVIVQGDDANTFDGRKAYKLIWDYAKSGKESDNLTRTIKQYFIDNKESVGAIVIDAQRPKTNKAMFIGDYYFHPVKTNFLEFQQAFIIMHESVHLIGNKGDAVFGGSKNLSLLLVESFMPVLKNNLGGVA